MTEKLTEREFWLMVRQALLIFVDAIERKYLTDLPRTSELRKRNNNAII